MTERAYAAYLDAMQRALHRGQEGAAESVAAKSNRRAERAIQTAELAREIESTDPLTARGLSFYLGSAQRRRLQFCQAAFPLLFGRALTAQQRPRLEAAYLRGPSGAQGDWTLNTGLLLGALQVLVAEGVLCDAHMDVAQHDRAMFTMARADAPVPATDDERSWRVNATLQANTFAHDLPRWLMAGPEAPALPASSSEPTTIGYYLHPDSLRPWWRRLDAPTLALMRIAEERVSVDQAASEGSASPEAIRAALGQLVEAGLLLR